MACACKTGKVLNSKYGSKNGESNKRGVSFYMKMLGEILFGRVFMSLFLVFVCICLFPFVIVSLFFSQLFGGKSRIFMPKKMIKNLKKIRGDE